jgi:hypothetical protein
MENDNSPILRLNDERGQVDRRTFPRICNAAERSIVINDEFGMALREIVLEPGIRAQSVTLR